MPTNREVLDEAIKICDPQLQMSPTKLGKTAYLNLGFAFNEDQWDAVWIDFLDAGGDSTVLDNGVTVVHVCPLPARSRNLTSFVESASQSADAESSPDRTTKRPWPPTEPERFAAVRDALIEHVEKNDHATAAAIQDEFARVGEKRIKEILDTLVALGVAQENNGKYSHSA
jgi:hypothetical protein